MIKVFSVIFAGLTAGAVYMTMNDVGVLDPTIRKPSVRQGSVASGGRVHGYGGLRGGYRGGK